MTPAFTKLQRSIVTSSIWLEDAETRLVWITLLAICDRDGIARVSDKMLAHTARVSDKGCVAAIKTLMAPDADSRDRGDGRRIARVEGGFYIVNYLEKLSEGINEQKRDYWADKKREERARKKAAKEGSGTVRTKHVDKPPTYTRKGAALAANGLEHDQDAGANASLQLASEQPIDPEI